MEAGFGRDFGDVRVHTEAAAADAARRIGARAFTSAGHVAFAPGEYAPRTTGGRRLLAHELAHVVQQARDPDAPALAGAWNACTGAESCPPREPGEAARARAASLAAGTLEAPERGIIVQPFAIGSSDASGLARDPTWAGFASRVASPDARWEILGFIDCEGSEARNADLRSARAAAVLRKLTPAARGQVDIARGAPLSDCVSDDATEEDRALNRSAVFVMTLEHIGLPGESVTAPACPPAAVTAATSISDYLSLVLCAESRFPGLMPRQMLSLLRQIYYGAEAWSNTNNAFWLDVIPCGLSFADPRPTLGTALFESLADSQDSTGVDIGHVFTGLESMFCPRPTVTLDVTGPINPTVATTNIAFATWSGDLGSAVARRVFDEADNGVLRAWPAYFGTPGTLASDEDLEGDVDSWAIRAGLTGGCGGSAMTTLPTLTAPISQLLFDYYEAIPGTAAGSARGGYGLCVARALGGHVAGSRITNKRDVADRIRPQVEAFARTFYLGLRTNPLFAIDVTRGILLFTYSQELSELFVDWLESRP